MKHHTVQKPKNNSQPYLEQEVNVLHVKELHDSNSNFHDIHNNLLTNVDLEQHPPDNYRGNSIESMKSESLQKIDGEYESKITKSLTIIGEVDKNSFTDTCTNVSNIAMEENVSAMESSEREIPNDRKVSFSKFDNIAIKKLVYIISHIFLKSTFMEKILEKRRLKNGEKFKKYKCDLILGSAVIKTSLQKSNTPRKLIPEHFESDYLDEIQEKGSQRETEFQKNRKSFEQSIVLPLPQELYGDDSSAISLEN